MWVFFLILCASTVSVFFRHSRLGGQQSNVRWADKNTLWTIATKLNNVESLINFTWKRIYIYIYIYISMAFRAQHEELFSQVCTFEAIKMISGQVICRWRPDPKPQLLCWLALNKMTISSIEQLDSTQKRRYPRYDTKLHLMVRLYSVIV